MDEKKPRLLIVFVPIIALVAIILYLALQPFVDY
jgi:hypothetical protein